MEINNTKINTKNLKKNKNLVIIQDKLEINKIILNNKLNNYTLLNVYNNNHFLIKIKIEDLLNLPIETFVNWEYNRPYDNGRCNEIAKFIITNKELFDSIIYVNYNNRHENFEIFDGMHRFMSLIKIKENIKNSNLNEYINTEINTKKDENIINRIEYEDKDEDEDEDKINNINWFYNSEILFNIRFNTHEDKIKEIFKNLNKCLPVSELYIRDCSIEKTSIINELLLEFENKYRKHFSFSRTTNIGNTNRTEFENLLNNIYDKYRININNIHILRNRIKNANEYLKNNIPKKALNKKATLEKCEKTGCYLFLLRNSELEDII